MIAATLATHPPAAATPASGHASKQALSFVPNRGQIDPRVRYYAQSAAFSAYFTERGVTLDLRKGSKGAAVELRFQGADSHPLITAGSRMPGTVSYFSGRQRYTSLPGYGAVRYHDLWPGIDLAFRSAAGKLKYEFVVRPGADPSRIRLAYAGADSLAVDRAGALVVGTPVGPITDSRPVSRQAGRTVASRYAMSGSAFGFALGAYDHARPLVIDPGLVYSTYLGGYQGDVVTGQAIDGDGNAYIVGTTSSPDYPTTPGAYDRTSNGGLFISKLTPSGGFVYSTLLAGNSGYEYAGGIAVDSLGHAFVLGTTDASDFPTTAGAYKTTLVPGNRTAFVTELNATGDGLIYSTFVGEASLSLYGGIVVDGAGSAYVTVPAQPGYPITPGAYGTSNGGVAVTKLTPAGDALAYSAVLGSGIAQAITIDGDGNAYVAGRAYGGYPTTPGAYQPAQHGSSYNAFVTKLNSSGSALVYSTFIGGSTSGDEAMGMALDGSRNVYLTGQGGSTDFPVTPGAYSQSKVGDTFAAKLNATGTALMYSTWLPADRGTAIGIDGSGSAYIAGWTRSSYLPVTPNAYDGTYNGGIDTVIFELDPTGSRLLYASFLGGSNADFSQALSVRSPGDLYLAGSTSSTDFPTTPLATQRNYAGLGDAYAVRLSIAPPDAYVRPKGAGPLLASLVPAYKQCADPTITHGAPLSYPSCAGPQLTSDYLTTGTPDANGKPGMMNAFVLIQPRAGNPSTPANEADVKLRLHVNDVFTKALADYTGGVRGLVSIRITDMDPAGHATTIDFPFGFNAPCVADPDPAAGSSCDSATSVNAVMPGAVTEGLRSVWALDRARVFDGGADGDPDTPAGNTQFLTQGLFVP